MAFSVQVRHGRDAPLELDVAEGTTVAKLKDMLAEVRIGRRGAARSASRRGGWGLGSGGEWDHPWRASCPPDGVGCCQGGGAPPPRPHCPPPGGRDGRYVYMYIARCSVGAAGGTALHARVPPGATRRSRPRPPGRFQGEGPGRRALSIACNAYYVQPRGSAAPEYLPGDAVTLHVADGCCKKVAGSSRRR